MKYPLKWPSGTILSGLAATQALDSSSEVLDIKGADISSFENGKGYVDYEHKTGSGIDIVGRILFAKKIFKKEDCDDQDQLKFWKSVELPCIYVICVLFDEDGHEGAKAVSSIINHYTKAKEPILLSFSIEGSTLEREGNLLKRTMCRGVAITLKPCNQSSILGIFEQKLIKPEEDSSVTTDIKNLIKPKYLSKVESVYTPFVPQNPFLALQKAVKMAKAIGAGMPNAAPGQLTQGAALQAVPKPKKTLDKGQLVQVFKKWDKKGSLKKFLKTQLPDASEDYIDKFSDLTDKLRLKKSINYALINRTLPKILITPLEKNERLDHGLVMKQIASHLGLGQHFPERSIFRDKESGESYRLTGKCYGRFPQCPLTDHDQDSLLPLLLDGTLDKLAVLDKILDVKRNVSNFVLSDDRPNIMLTESEIGSGFEMPDYLNAHMPKHQSHNISLRPLHPECMFFIESMNENRLGDILRENGVDESKIKDVQGRLAKIKQMVNMRKDLLLKDVLEDKEL